MQKFSKLFFILGFSILCVNCKKQTLFQEQSSLATGVKFVNQLNENEQNNVLTYEYFYNGGGLAIGDLNNDGYSDIYFSGNTVKNELYLNEGNWNFNEVTKKTGVGGKKGWKTGVTMADVNGDGRLDIYVSYSGNAPAEGFDKPVIRNYPGRANQLFINQGNDSDGIPSFTEKAKEYGLDAIGTFSTQAYFFDYDLDGDLDMFLLNHANKFYSAFFNTKRLRSLRHPFFGNKLFQNNNNKFVEVTEGSGIHGSGINFGLSAAISDLNKDGYPDIYVTNDYQEQDFCYLNNGDGSFREVSHTAFGHLSKFGMGSDIADINNDALPDIFVADMLPEDNYRQKVLQGPDEYSRFKTAVDSGYHYQYMRNTLQINQGLSPDSLMKFSEIGQFSGVSNTDWSWAPLIADYDNDGLKDIFVTNGFLRDYSNLDFRNYTANETIRNAKSKNQEVSLLPLISKIPSTKIANYYFENKGDNRFINSADKFGLGKRTVSNAAAYGDLDNDGDLDLVVNNNNEPALIYKNNQDKMFKNNYLKIKLEGSNGNSFGIGSKIIIDLPGKKSLYQEAFFGRGYQSSMEPILTIGLGKLESVSSIKVVWPSGKLSVISAPKINKLLVIKESSAIKKNNFLPLKPKKNLLKDVTQQANLDFVHSENDFIDFYHSGLLPYQLSKSGGKAAVGDVNGDGNDDVFFGNASGNPGQLYFGEDDGKLRKNTALQPWKENKTHMNQEDISPLFFDADGDNDLDLYLVSGGTEHGHGTDYFQDRIYLNDGNGNFTTALNALPDMRFSGSVVKSADFDKDGDLDLFIGGRMNAKNYPLPSRSVVLRNNTSKGRVHFTSADVLSLEKPGMVTDAVWKDIDKDSWPDLILTGEWMPITIFKNEQGKLINKTFEYGLKETDGWWFSLKSGDFDNDGDIDFLCGNWGLNSQFRASNEEPMKFHIQDIDNNGRIDPLLSYYIDGKSYPFPSRDELLGQVPSLKKLFVRYETYANTTMSQLLDKAGIAPQKVLSIKTLESSFLENKENGKFEINPLPLEAQQSVIQDFEYEDFNNDGSREILAAGNLFPLRVSIGKIDASFGSLMDYEDGALKINQKDGKKLWLEGDIRDLQILNFNSGKKRLLVVRNNDRASLHEIQRNK
ncbi:VCBS repeat protein [Salegentibacter sp. 24]|uniref:VCBS repeat-containing protein n=1 Tax=Salegentibacter sp. 24 TaxID=2183986 RepID=UPI0010609289|nr:VCBS repeat-containing protein [Salegentibacter sp. 24]TDN95087.1 VCBS repeat protein [Salegentibacter sp. 24]